MAFCTACGSNIPDGINFCTECGKSMGVSASSSSSVEKISQTQQTPSRPQPVPPPQTMTQPGPQGEAPPISGSRYAVMSVGAYIGYSLLFSLPVIGWIICLVMAFTSKNLNKRNFAKAILIFMVIGFVTSIILFFLFRLVSEVAFQQFYSIINGMIGNFDLIK